MHERRRSPRYPVDSKNLATQSNSLTVQVLDISVGGVMLRSSRPVKVGARGVLRLTVGGQSFSADVAVTRVSASDASYRIGAMFGAMTPEHRQVIERFTKQ
jgi:c-di-GMP-binding flagellar brake protein YcgR